MTIPICCGKRATQYLKRWRASWESGFRCKKCNRIRIPFIDALDQTYMNSLDAIREAGIAFDATLTHG